MGSIGMRGADVVNLGILTCLDAVSSSFAILAAGADIILMLLGKLHLFNGYLHDLDDVRFLFEKGTRPEEYVEMIRSADSPTLLQVEKANARSAPATIQKKKSVTKRRSIFFSAPRMSTGSEATNSSGVEVDDVVLEGM